MDQPEAAALILSSDLQRALALIRESDPLLASPWRIVYRLIKADPVLAASLLAEFHRLGETLLVTESLAYLAYDKDLQERSSRSPISLAEDGNFLNALFPEAGPEWLRDRLSESVELYKRRVLAREVGGNFLERYRDTLDAAAASLGEPEARTDLPEVIRRAFGPS